MKKLTPQILVIILNGYSSKNCSTDVAVCNRKMLVKVTNYLKSVNKINVDTLSIVIPPNNSFEIYDATIYIVFSIINDDLISTISQELLEKLIKIAIISDNSNCHLVDTLLNHLPSTSIKQTWTIYKFILRRHLTY